MPPLRCSGRVRREAGAAVSTYAPPVPVRVRTARKQHQCDDCCEPIEPGDKYELCVTPPHREECMDSAHWLTWRSHYPRTGPAGEHLLGCDLAAAYREKAERESAGA